MYIKLNHIGLNWIKLDQIENMTWFWKKDMVLVLILFWINLPAVLVWLSILLNKLNSFQSEFLFIYYRDDKKAWRD